MSHVHEKSAFPGAGGSAPRRSGGQPKVREVSGVGDAVESARPTRFCLCVPTAASREVSLLPVLPFLRSRRPLCRWCEPEHGTPPVSAGLRCLRRVGRPTRPAAKIPAESPSLYFFLSWKLLFSSEKVCRLLGPVRHTVGAQRMGPI